MQRRDVGAVTWQRTRQLALSQIEYFQRTPFAPDTRNCSSESKHTFSTEEELPPNDHTLDDDPTRHTFTFCRRPPSLTPAPSGDSLQCS